MTDAVGILLVGALVLVFVGLVLALVLVQRQKRNLAGLLASQERLQAEADQKDRLVKELTASSDQLRAGINGLGAAIWDWDMQTRELYVSELFLEMTGYQREEFTNNMARIPRYIHPDDIDHVRRIFTDYLEGRLDRCAFELRLKFQDGDYHWVESKALVTRDEQGRPLRLVGSLSDISEKVLAEEERDRLFNLSVDMLAVGGFDGSFHQLNPAWVRVLGWSRDDILGEPLLHFIHEQDKGTMKDSLQMLKEGEPVRGVESRFRCRDGSYRWLSWSSFPYPDHQLIFSVVRDVTEQKEAETKVMDYQDRLRSLSNQLALVEDRQRQQLATAIHDGLAQQLFGVRAQVTLLKYPDKLSDYEAVVQETLDILDETMKEARNLSFELFPPVLHEVGLEAALTWLAHQFNLRTGLPCSVTVEGEGEELPEDLRAMAYQSVRELLNNVYKHAEATEVNISLNHVPDYLTVLVDDNGVGFDISPDQAPRISEETGFGLFSIRERLRSVGGRMLVDSRPGKGCRVFLSIPRNP
jgi:PAS domain S-box-containing protein